MIEERIRDERPSSPSSSHKKKTTTKKKQKNPRRVSSSSSSSSPSLSSSLSLLRQDKRDQLNNRVKDSADESPAASPASSPRSGGGKRGDGVEEEADTEEEGGNWSQEAVTVKCIIPGETSLHPRLKRQVFGHHQDLPDNFTESAEELIDYSGNVTAQAPLPLLNIAVKQNGEFVDTALNVSPGTPLEMIIYLDDVSANVYGLLTSFLRVTDNTPRKQEEIIILNGCSIDPYIFANFETEDAGKSLSAKFRAFKFPESSYVLFVGTVNVCLKSCQGVQCGEGQIGYGRRRRSSIPYDIPFDANKVFEAELTAFVKVGYNSLSSHKYLDNNRKIMQSSAPSPRSRKQTPLLVPHSLKMSTLSSGSSSSTSSSSWRRRMRWASLPSLLFFILISFSLTSALLSFLPVRRIEGHLL